MGAGRKARVQIDREKVIPISSPVPGAVRRVSRSRRGGFHALQKEAKSRRRSEAARVLISIAGLAVLVALFVHLLSG